MVGKWLSQRSFVIYACKFLAPDTVIDNQDNHFKAFRKTKLSRGTQRFWGRTALNDGTILNFATKATSKRNHKSPLIVCRKAQMIPISDKTCHCYVDGIFLSFRRLFSSTAVSVPFHFFIFLWSKWRFHFSSLFSGSCDNFFKFHHTLHWRSRDQVVK